jgi:hypothetical protein
MQTLESDRTPGLPRMKFENLVSNDSGGSAPRCVLMYALSFSIADFLVYIFGAFSPNVNHINHTELPVVDLDPSAFAQRFLLKFILQSESWEHHQRKLQRGIQVFQIGDNNPSAASTRFTRKYHFINHLEFSEIDKTVLIDIEVFHSCLEVPNPQRITIVHTYNSCKLCGSLVGSELGEGSDGTIC